MGSFVVEIDLVFRVKVPVSAQKWKNSHLPNRVKAPGFKEFDLLYPETT
jgi:hypothetical protein